MTLQAVLASLDDVQEEHKSLYAEKDGQFILDVTGADNLPEVSGLRNAYQQEKAKRTELNTKITDLTSKIEAMPADFDMDVWNKAKSGSNVDAEAMRAAVEAAKVDTRQAMEAEVSDWKGKFEGLQSEIRTATSTTALTDALTAAGVTEGVFLEASRSMLNGSVRYDDDGKPYMESNLGPMPIGDYVERWAKDAGKAFVTPPKGSGAKGETTKSGTTHGAVNPELAAKVPGLADLPAR